MRFSGCVLCGALLASSATAQEVDVDPSLPRYRPVAGVIGVLRGHGSRAMGKLMTIWGEGFERIYPSARLALDDAFLEDIVRGAATHGPLLHPMFDTCVRRFKARFGYAPPRIPVSFYMLAVYVHKDNPFDREGLLMEEVKTIFSARFKDKKWGYLGCGGEWSKRPITLYAPRGPSSSRAYRFFDEYCGLDFSWKDSVRWRPDNAAVVASVEEDTRGIGLALIGCRTDKIRALPLAPFGGSEFVPATAANAWNGAYPLSRAFDLLLNHDPRAGFELDRLRREFLRYILSREGQQAVVKVGHVPVSAEIAGRALAEVGLVPSREGSWDRMLSRLRARRLPNKRMDRMERLTRRIGDQPTYEQLVDLAKALARTGLTSAVTFETDREDATIMYRFLGQRPDTSTAQGARSAMATVPIGLYHMWTERAGRATSPKDAWFEIIRERERIKIYESR